MLDDFAIEGAERLERRLGKRAALRTLGPFFESMSEGKPRARVHLKVMTLCAELDPARFEQLAQRWEREPHGTHRAVKSVVRRLLADGLERCAARLSTAEVVRTRGAYDEASAVYLLARSLEAASDPGALAAYDRAALLAEEQPRLRERAQVRALRVTADRDQAARRAEGLLPLAGGPDADRLAVAVAALSSSGRYRRAAALDVLEELAAGEGEVARHALARAALHAEGASSSAIEVDRVRAVLAHARCEAALDALEHLQRAGGASAAESEGGRTLLRARAVLDGCAPGPRPPRGRALVGWLALSIVHACQERRASEARALLREAAALLAEGARVEAALWTAARLAIEVAKEPARALTAALLERADAESPPGGYLPIADEWLARGERAEGLLLLRCAARVREPGARSRLAAHLRADGWEAAAAGRRDEAIALLREARHLGLERRSV